jgi:hypothetical protein
MTPEQAKQYEICEACGESHKAYPQHHGEKHRCGPKDWAAYQNSLLKMILAAVSGRRNT